MPVKYKIKIFHKKKRNKITDDIKNDTAFHLHCKTYIFALKIRILYLI